MTTASKITLVRVVLIPVFMVLLLCSGGNDALRWAALGVFVVASISDFVDGYIARHYNQVTDFGKFLDPIADKRSVADYSDWLVREILPMQDIPQIKYLAGVHPYGAPDYTDDVHAQVVAALDDPLCAGIGEIGLDYHMDYDDDIAPAPHNVQIDCMARQLELAVRRNVPVELHLRHEDSDGERTSHVDAYNVLREVGAPQAGCVLHCFGEDRATMERFVGLGCYIAYGGAATFKRNDDVREAFAATPLDRILFETDCPYMAPEPIRGLECEPAMISITANTLVNDRVDRTGEDAEAIAQAAWENACKLFQK